ncbi:hypothetical protein QTV49_004878 [Vibrio vulnificus]|nr:hypothetical protein [Vibrio vulnificus]
MFGQEREIDLSDYFDANLLDGKEGKVSADQSKIRFGDLFVDISPELMVTNDTLQTGEFEEGASEVLTESSFNLHFPASKSVQAHMLRIPSEDKLYWLLAVSTPIPKKLIKNKKEKNFVAVLSVGTES